MTDSTVERCVIVVDDTLPPGLAANAAAILALTLGATAPELIGSQFVDRDGHKHPGLIARGLPVLCANREQLRDLSERASAVNANAISLPTIGQQTTDYEVFRKQVAKTATADLDYLAVLVHGRKRTVGKLTGHLSLLP